MHRQKKQGESGRAGPNRQTIPAKILPEPVLAALGLDTEPTKNRLLTSAIEAFELDPAGPASEFLLKRAMRILEDGKVDKDHADQAFSRFPKMVRESIEPPPSFYAEKIVGAFIESAKGTEDMEFKACVMVNAWELVPHLLPKEMSETKEELVRIQAEMQRESGKEFPEITEAAKEAETRETPSVSLVRSLEELKEEERNRVMSEEVERRIEPAPEPDVEALDDGEWEEVGPPRIPPEKKPPRKEVTDIQVSVYQEGSISVPVDKMVALGDGYQLKSVARREEPPYNCGFDLFFKGDYVGYILVIENGSQTFFLSDKRVTISNQEDLSVEIEQPGGWSSFEEYESIMQSIGSYMQDPDAPDSHSHIVKVREEFERLKEDRPRFDSAIEMACRHLLASDDHHALERIASSIRSLPEELREAREAIIISAKLPVEQHRWAVFNSEMSAFEQCEDRDDAEGHFENALEILEQRKGDSGLFPATLESIQATVIRTENKNEIAEKALRKAIELALTYKEESPDWGFMMADKAGRYLFSHVRDTETITWIKQSMIQLVNATMWSNKAHVIEEIERMGGQEAPPDERARPPPIPAQSAQLPPLPASAAKAPAQGLTDVERPESSVGVKYVTSEQTIRVIIEDAGGWIIPDICLNLGDYLELRYSDRVEYEDADGNQLPEARFFELQFGGNSLGRLRLFSGETQSLDWEACGIKLTVYDQDEAGATIEMQGSPEKIREIRERLPQEFSEFHKEKKVLLVLDEEPPKADAGEEVSEPVIRLGKEGIEVPDEISRVAPLPARPQRDTQELSGSGLGRALMEEIDLDKPVEALALKVQENAGLILCRTMPGALSETLWKTDNLEKMTGALLKRSALPDPPPGSELLAYNYSGKLGLIRYDTWVDQTDDLGRQIKMSYVVVTEPGLAREVIDHIIKSPSDAFALFNGIFSDGLTEQGTEYTADSPNARKGELLALNRDEISEADREHLRYNWEQHFGKQTINYSTVAPGAQLGIAGQFADALKRGDMESARALKKEVKTRGAHPKVAIATDIEGARTQLTPSCSIVYGGQETRKMVKYKKLAVIHPSGEQSFEVNRYMGRKEFVTDEGILVRITTNMKFQVEANVLELPEPSEAEKVDEYTEKTYIMGEEQGSQTAVPLGRGYRLEWGGRIHDEGTNEFLPGMRRFRIRKEGTRRTRGGLLDDTRYDRDLRMAAGEERTFTLDAGLLRVTIANKDESADVTVKEGITGTQAELDDEKKELAVQGKEGRIVDSLLFMLVNDRLKETIGRDGAGHEVSGVFLLPENDQGVSVAEILGGRLKEKSGRVHVFDLDGGNTAKVRGLIPVGETRWGIPKESTHLTDLKPIGEIKIEGKEYSIFDQEVGEGITGRITLRTGLKPYEELRRGSTNSERSIMELLSGVRPED